MKLIYFIIHMFTGCPEEDLLYQYRGKKAECHKCGRTHFVFNQYKD